MDLAKDLVRITSSHFRELSSAGSRLVDEALRYHYAVSVFMERLYKQASVRRDFSMLMPEQYRPSPARRRPPRPSPVPDTTDPIEEARRRERESRAAITAHVDRPPIPVRFRWATTYEACMAPRSIRAVVPVT